MLEVFDNEAHPSLTHTAGLTFTLHCVLRKCVCVFVFTGSYLNVEISTMSSSPFLWILLLYYIFEQIRVKLCFIFNKILLNAVIYCPA